MRLHPFLCVVADGTPEALEHGQIGWFRPDEFPHLPLAAADRIVAKQVRGRLPAS